MGRWQCCGRQFDSEEASVRHDVEAHGAAREPVGTCCGLAFYTREGLEEHARTAHGQQTATSG
ncbi:MAG: hypothetical protein N0A24_10250 [Armatimonadetes bacterium]|nr:hypothetical protein [Armatimonadota bacterium]MDW8154554.1 hypothetical protein [Armatimonadota bacterium]